MGKKSRSVFPAPFWTMLPLRVFHLPRQSKHGCLELSSTLATRHRRSLPARVPCSPARVPHTLARCCTSLCTRHGLRVAGRFGLIVLSGWRQSPWCQFFSLSSRTPSRRTRMWHPRRTPSRPTPRWCRSCWSSCGRAGLFAVGYVCMPSLRCCP